MQIRDRIKELRRVPASQLQPNPLNWRTHPRRQQDALRGILAEVGYADALLARETSAGGLMLIDGHLRAETTPDALVPVLILDVDEAEAAKILATLDPLAAMAQADAGRLDRLLREVDTKNEALQELLARLADENGALAGDEDAKLQAMAADDITSDGQQSRGETKYAVIINCDSEEQQLALLERFDQEGLSCRALLL
jgi:hypothetical protein